MSDTFLHIMNPAMIRNRVAERVRRLGLTKTGDGVLEIGAMTRQEMLEHSPLIAARCPLLGEATALIDCLDWERPREYSYGEIDRLATACARG